jgi:hypothetical protein
MARHLVDVSPSFAAIDAIGAVSPRSVAELGWQRTGSGSRRNDGAGGDRDALRRCRGRDKATRRQERHAVLGIAICGRGRAHNGRKVIEKCRLQMG